jgi:hypothetical protein
MCCLAFLFKYYDKWEGEDAMRPIKRSAFRITLGKIAYRMKRYLE